MLCSFNSLFTVLFAFYVFIISISLLFAFFNSIFSLLTFINFYLFFNLSFWFWILFILFLFFILYIYYLILLHSLFCILFKLCEFSIFNKLIFLLQKRKAFMKYFMSHGTIVCPKKKAYFSQSGFTYDYNFINGDKIALGNIFVSK